jgi:hypothetical protein
MRVIVVLLAPLATILGMAITVRWRTMRTEFLDSQRKLRQFDPGNAAPEDVQTILRMGALDRNALPSRPDGGSVQLHWGIQPAPLGNPGTFDRILGAPDPLRIIGGDPNGPTNSARSLRVSWWIIASGLAMLATWLMMQFLNFLGFADKALPTLILVALPFAIITIGVMDPHRDGAAGVRSAGRKDPSNTQRRGPRKSFSRPAGWRWF